MPSWNKIGGGGVGSEYHSVTFEYTGATQQFTVPANVYLLWVFMSGGGGGGSSYGTGGGSSGVMHGAAVLVYPGDVLDVGVGGGGAAGIVGNPGGTTTFGGYTVNGGGGASSGSGGAGGTIPSASPLTDVWVSEGITGTSSNGGGSPIPYSPGGIRGVGAGAGGDGSGWGSGGGPSSANGVGTGGNGAPGVVTVEYLESVAP